MTERAFRLFYRVRERIGAYPLAVSAYVTKQTCSMR
jgi:hypothetical protein